MICQWDIFVMDGQSDLGIVKEYEQTGIRMYFMLYITCPVIVLTDNVQ